MKHIPIIKAIRTDILRKPEIDTMLEKADDRLKCVIALAWIFGKRINEILTLKREDIWVQGDFLFVRFHVGKKKERQAQIIPKPYLKKIRTAHPYVSYILNWIEKFQQGYVFPSYGVDHSKKVYSKKYDKVYTYQVIGGHLTPQRIWQLLKEINPNVWAHLFRESLATWMAENDATEEDLMHWFDWDDPRMAHRYVKHGTRLTEKWSERKW